MNWEALGAVGETVGAVGVILTLVYLALQIRQNSRQIVQNTQSLRLAAAHGFKQDTQDLRLTIAQDPEMTRILQAGVLDTSTLDENDRVRFNLILAAIFDHLQFAFGRREEGLIDWDAQEKHICSYLAQPGTQEWWRSGRAIFNDDFVKYVEEKLLPLSKDSRPHWAPTPTVQSEKADQP